MIVLTCFGSKRVGGTGKSVSVGFGLMVFVAKTIGLWVEVANNLVLVRVAVGFFLGEGVGVNNGIVGRSV